MGMDSLRVRHPRTGQDRSVSRLFSVNELPAVRVGAVGSAAQRSLWSVAVAQRLDDKLRSDYCCLDCPCRLACSESLDRLRSASRRPFDKKRRVVCQAYRMVSSISPFILAWRLMSRSRSISTLTEGAPP